MLLPMAMFALQVCSLGTADSTALTYHVAPGGADHWSGLIEAPSADGADGPFATLQRAVRAIAEAPRAGDGVLAQPVTVLLRDGAYYLEETLVLGPEHSGTRDCPVVIRSYPGERAVVSGGRRVEGWRKIDDRLWGVDLDAVRNGDWHFRTLRVGDGRAVRARYPDFDPDNPIAGGWLFAQPLVLPEGHGLFGFGVGNIHNRGDRLEWEVDIPAEGEYVVWTRYGHKMRDYNRESMDGHTEFGVVGGASAPLEDLPDTGGWSPVRWSRSATLALPAGPQTLFWQNLKGGGLTLDAFCLTDDPEWNPAQAIRIHENGEHTATPPADGRHMLLIHAETCARAIGPEITVGKPEPKGAQDRLVLRPGDFPRWSSWDDVELHIFPAWGWVNTITRVLGVDEDAGALRVDCRQEIRPGNRFFLAGAREALDSPGEWHLDRATGALRYWPTDAAFPDIETVAPALDRLIAFRGDAEADRFVEYVELRGLTFMDSGYTLDHTYSPNEGAVGMEAARRCVVEDCRFTLLDGYGVVMTARSHENEVVGNTMTALGQGGVMLDGGTAVQAYDNLIAANTITDCGVVYKHVAGVYVTTGSGNRIAHNRILRMPRYGVSLKSYNPENYSRNNVVEFNEIIDSNLETNDTGAIETLGRDNENSGNVIRYNLMRNVVGFKTTSTGEILSPHFTWGIYLDDYSSGTTVRGNIVDGTTIGGFCIHAGKDNHFENNIFLNASEQQLRLQPRDDFMTGNTFQRNIVAYRAADSTLWYAFAHAWRADRLAACDYNVYWCYGDLDIETTERSITPAGTFAAWKALGFDAHSEVADPRFVSPTLEHFRLEEDSPALRLGFQPIPEDRIGPEGFVRGPAR